MFKTSHRFPRSTFGRYVPGVGTTITQANIAATQTALRDACEKAKQEFIPLTAEQITFLFIYGQPMPAGSHMPKGRHLSRTYRLMYQGE